MVDVEKLAQELAELANKTTTKRKKMSVIRDLFDSIETAMQRGVSRSDIVQKLRSDGVDIDERQLTVCLSKIRVERGELKAPRKKSHLGTGAVNPQTAAVESNAPTTQVQPQKTQPVRAAESPKKASSTVSGAALFGERPAPGLRPANLELDDEGDQK